jgi:phosphoglycolate phosphatase
MTDTDPKNLPFDPGAVDHLLWDWNGTLLDDVDLCIDALHQLCTKRGIPLVSHDEYRAKFTFPVIDYYEAVGFDFEAEPFSVPADEWVEIYSARVWDDTGLHKGAVDVLEHLRGRGYSQSILSAYNHEMLVRVMEHFGVAGFFDPILGLGDFYAESKEDLGVAWMGESGLDPARVVMIGDTLHDHEVAEAMGVHCVLIAQGHQSKERLLEAGVPVLEGLAKVPVLLGAGVW